MTDEQWKRSLDRLDQTLGRRSSLRLRVACPSQEFSRDEMAHGLGRWLSCVRGLWESMTLIRDPDLALVMLQAPVVPGEVMSYLFGLSPAGRLERAKPAARHALVELQDGRELHLSEKVLGTPELIARMRSTVRQARQRGQTVEGLSCYATSERMAELADALGIELLATAPHLLHWGSKAGGRQLFRRAGVPHPPGSYGAERDLVALCHCICALVSEHGAGRWLVKVTDGFGSGHGNAVVEVERAEDVTAEWLIQRLSPASPDVSKEQFLDRVRAVGAIVEKFVDIAPGGTVRHPSVSAELRRTDGGAVDIAVLGTHEQVIDDTQQYVGCRFPADHAYRADLLQATRLILTELARVGAVGHVGVDFLARTDAGPFARWTLQALEVNLRQTGTTHPNGAVRALVDGSWQPDGRLLDARGTDVYYAATDGLVSDSFRGISARGLVQALHATPDLSYDANRARGVVPHLWTTLEPHGKVGATFIGPSPEYCDELHERFVALLGNLAIRRDV